MLRTIWARRFLEGEVEARSRRVAGGVGEVAAMLVLPVPAVPETSTLLPR